MDGNREIDRMSQKRTAVLKKQVQLMSQEAEREYEDLEYIVHRITTSLDFIATCAQETIDKWKTGEVLKHNSLEDLKFKFRLDSFSVDDGWRLYFTYPDWIRRQREKILVLIGFMGTEPRESEDIDATITRAEQAEWAKGFAMDMDVIWALKDMRRVLQITHAMEPKLRDLEVACKNRSTQILMPGWEPRRRWR
jgi:hypothetical protein